MTDLKKIGDLFVLLGAIIGLLQGILLLLPDLGFTLGFVNLLGGFLNAFVRGILVILFSLIALVNSGFLKIKALDFGKTNKFIVVLIIGIMILLFSGDIAGLLVILGAIFWVL